MSVNALEAAAARIMANIDRLYEEIEQDPHVLNHIDSVPFFNTPLHVAALVDLPKHIQFATEIMTLKPSFALKLNRQGLTPIHLALQNGSNTMALHLVDINKDLVRVKMKGGLTPLHLASQSGNIHLLTEFLKACPDSVGDVTVKGETVLHFAAKYQKFDAFEFLVKSLMKKAPQLRRTILNRKDEDGNTILHIAALNNATEAIELLTMRTTAILTMDFDAENLSGQTALNLASSAYIRRILVQARVSNRGRIGSLLLRISRSFQFIYEELVRFRGPMTEENRNAYLVVATLVATTTYQAALSPPGGFHQSDVIGTNHTLTHLPSILSITEGKSVMSNSYFLSYSSMNMLAFLTSTITIMFIMPKKVGSLLLHAATYLLIPSFYLSMTIISPTDYTTKFLKVTLFLLTGIMIIMAAAVIGRYDEFSTNV